MTSQVKGLREAFEDISLRVPARGGVAQVGSSSVAAHFTTTCASACRWRRAQPLLLQHSNTHTHPHVRMPYTQYTRVQVSAAVASFVTLEARLGASGSDPEVIPSWKLPELTYRIVGVARWGFCAVGSLGGGAVGVGL